MKYKYIDTYIIYTLSHGSSKFKGIELAFHGSLRAVIVFEVRAS